MTTSSKEKQIRAAFEYYIERHHCRKNTPKMHYKDMCKRCRDLSYLKETLKKVRDEVIIRLK